MLQFFVKIVVIEYMSMRLVALGNFTGNEERDWNSSKVK